jgi:multidrug efflux pump subunit AcrA (membrane-fusion protein)
MVSIKMAEVSTMRKQIISMLLAAVLVLSLAGCGEAGTVSVQRADQLALAGQAQDRHAGMVVSENMAQIPRDGSKTISEVYVTVGQEVKAGDKLFTYDSKALELELEKAQLEVEKMKNELQTHEEQLAALNQQLSWTWDTSAQVRLTLEINTLETAIMETEYQLAAKEVEGSEERV